MNMKFIFSIIVTFLILGVTIIAQTDSRSKSRTSNNNEVKTKVTFIELGSVKCIPCKMMQPVMKNIKKKIW